MTVEVGGAGVLGVAVETTMGTWLTPTKFIPIRSESLQSVEDKVYRTNIRGLADRSGAIQGYTHTEGEIEFEVTSDVLPYFLYAARVAPTKTGAMPPYTYTFTPAHVAKASTAAGATNRRTLSISVLRGGNGRGFVGCSVGQLAFTLDAGVLMCTASIVGMSEATQTIPAATWATSVPLGPGKVTLEIPTGTPRADADTFSVTINDNLETSNRLNGVRSAAYQNWGEREITMSVEVDFDTLTDFNAFMAQTQQSVKFIGTNSAVNDEVAMTFAASIQDSFATGLSSLGDVNRATLEYHAIYGTTDAYSIVVKTIENIT